MGQRPDEASLLFLDENYKQSGEMVMESDRAMNSPQDAITTRNGIRDLVSSQSQAVNAVKETSMSVVRDYEDKFPGTLSGHGKVQGDISIRPKHTDGNEEEADEENEDDESSDGTIMSDEYAVDFDPEYPNLEKRQ